MAQQNKEYKILKTEEDKKQYVNDLVLLKQNIQINMNGEKE